MAPRSVQSGEIKAFYAGAVVGLRALDARSTRARRFGSEIDATWRAFRGDLAALTDGDRLDLLLREAAVAYPVGFSPRLVFQLDGLAADEPFGRDWPGVDPVLAAQIVREAAPADGAAGGALRRVAGLWRARVGRVDPPLGVVRPASRIVAAGVGAIIALAERFDGEATLDLGDQVLLVTASPWERQLFGLAAALLGTARPLRFVPPSATTSEIAAAGFPRLDLAVVSDDAGAESQALARSLVGGA